MRPLSVRRNGAAAAMTALGLTLLVAPVGTATAGDVQRHRRLRLHLRDRRQRVPPAAPRGGRRVPRRRRVRRQGQPRGLPDRPRAHGGHPLQRRPDRQRAEGCGYPAAQDLRQPQLGELLQGQPGQPPHGRAVQEVPLDRQSLDPAGGALAQLPGGAGGALRSKTFESAPPAPAAANEHELKLASNVDVLKIQLDWPTPDDLDLEVYRKRGGELTTVVGVSVPVVEVRAERASKRPAARLAAMTILDDARAGMDPPIRPQDDLFGHVNGQWLAAARDPRGPVQLGRRSSLLAEQAEQQVREHRRGVLPSRPTAPRRARRRSRSATCGGRSWTRLRSRRWARSRSPTTWRRSRGYPTTPVSRRSSAGPRAPGRRRLLRFLRRHRRPRLRPLHRQPGPGRARAARRVLLPRGQVRRDPRGLRGLPARGCSRSPGTTDRRRRGGRGPGDRSSRPASRRGTGSGPRPATSSRPTT